MTSVTEETAAAVVTQSSSMTYDAFDRRIARTVDPDGAGPDLPGTTTFAWDGQHIWLDGDGNNSITARYLYGEEIDDLLARHRPIDGTAWYLTDQVGSVTAIVDSAGAILNQIAYDSFGNVLSQSSAASSDRFLFTGREYSGTSVGTHHFPAN